MKRGKKIITLLILMVFGGYLNYLKASEIPSKTCLWFLPTMSLEQARTRIQFDYVVVDPECGITSREAIDYLRANHPGIKILCYINPPEWFDPMFPDKPWSLHIVAELKKYPNWWLKGTDGKKITFWPGMWTMDCRINCQKYLINGQRLNYLEFLWLNFRSDILDKYPYDGVLFDNAWDKAAWLGHYKKNKHGLDANNDRREDNPTQFDLAWKKGLTYFLSQVRQYGGTNFIIIANPANKAYVPLCNGKEFENFPDIYCKEGDKKFEAWYENLNRANSWSGFCLFTARTNNYFFTLCSAVLLDHVSFAPPQNSAYDQKYELFLGEALSKAETFRESGRSGYKRRFQNGTVYVDPELKKSWINYNDGHCRAE